jgi:23S rRNA (pseudouridine1915-N3)-methyltransferase
MRLKIVSFIKHQEAPLRELEQDYLARIRRRMPCEMAELRREKIGKRVPQSVLREETRRALRALKESPGVVVLDRQGKEYDSRELAAWLKERIGEGLRELVFVLGGPLGISEELAERARWKLSLSRLTFPHKLARVIVLEALYRSCEILAGGPYPK